MSKNVKTNKVKSHNDSPLNFPQKHTFDELAVIDDDILLGLHKNLIDSVNRAGSHGLNSAPWEVELCYVQRELQIRSIRRDAHTQYLASLANREVE